MPRTVLLAVVCVGSYGVLALVFLPNAVLELAGRRGMALFTQVISVISLAFSVVAAIWTVRGLARRRERARVGAFAVGVAMAAVFGVLAFTVAIIVATGSQGRVGDGLLLLGMMLAASVLPLGVAWALSRPAAKAWFAPASSGAHAARA